MRHIQLFSLLKLATLISTNASTHDWSWTIVILITVSATAFAGPVLAEQSTNDSEASAAKEEKECGLDSSEQECTDTTNSNNKKYYEGPCEDEHENCKTWSDAGECSKNPGYMLVKCRRSCSACEHEVDINDFGKPQIVVPSHATEIRNVIHSTLAYMQDVVYTDPEYEIIRDKCLNDDARCSEWALGSGCDDNPAYMKVHCAPACQSCDYVLESQKRCGLDPNGVDAIEKGGMNGLFERMVRAAAERGYTPKIWSKPLTNDTAGGETQPCGDDITNPCDVPDGPWVITLENFISAVEVGALRKWGAGYGYERSQAGNAIIDVRTSSHAWCIDDCYRDPVIVALRQRIVDVTGIPEDNYECLQLLKYEEGQYYKPHNDFIENHTEQSHGPRLLTFFIYFDEVEEGGETRFPDLDNLTVSPRQGRVLIWPSVKDENPYEEDSRTSHEAVTVLKGKKFAANAWIHMRDFQSGFRKGCPG